MRKATMLTTAIIVAVSGMLTSSVVVPGRAAAHGGEVVLTVDSANPAGELAVEYTVRLTYEGDGHPVEGAAVTAFAEGPVGQFEGRETLGPVTMSPVGDGLYRATVEFPTEMQWSVRFTSMDPRATLSVVQDVVGEGAQVPVVSEPNATVLPAAGAGTNRTAADSAPEADGSSSSTDDGSTTVIWWVTATAAVLLVAAGLVVVARRRSADGTPPS